MTVEEFVKAFHSEKEHFLTLYLNDDVETMVGNIIKELNISEEKKPIVNELLDCVLTDAFYTILLGLDGSASIGGIQEIYDLKDEEGNQLSGSGEIEEYAYEYFQEED